MADPCEHCGGDGCMWCTTVSAADRLQEWEAAETEIATAAAATVPAPPTRVTVSLTPEQWSAIHGACSGAVRTVTNAIGPEPAALLESTLAALYDAAAGIQHVP